jgi:hypothetical protein
MARGGHGCPKVSLGYAISYPSMPSRQPALKWLYGHFTGSHMQGRQLAAVFYLFGHPHHTFLDLRIKRNGKHELWLSVPQLCSRCVNDLLKQTFSLIVTKLLKPVVKKSENFLVTI